MGKVKDKKQDLKKAALKRKRLGKPKGKGPKRHATAKPRLPNQEAYEVGFQEGAREQRRQDSILEREFLNTLCGCRTIAAARKMIAERLGDG